MKFEFEITLSGETMGTNYHIKYNDTKQKLEHTRQPHLVKQSIELALEEINRQMSTWRENSEISAFNRMDAGKAMPISPEFARVIEQAQTIHTQTQGGLDISVGALVNLWGFGATGTRTMKPNQTQIAKTLRLCGMNGFQLDWTSPSPTLTKNTAGLYLDVSSIGKGLGVDIVSDILATRWGISDYLVEIGGEIRASGCNLGGKPWQIEIESPLPEQSNGSNIIIQLEKGALATSGDYKNYRDGFSHLIHPKTGSALKTDLASVSVIADTSMRADGLATGLLVLGAEQSWRLAQENGWAVLLMIRTSNNQMTTKITDEFLAFQAAKN